MLKNTIALFSAVTLPGGATSNSVPEINVTGLNKEVAVFGYTLDRHLMDDLRRLSPSAFTRFHAELRAALTDLSGSDMAYGVLFNRFPYETPEHNEYLNRRIIGFMQNLVPDGYKSNVVLSCGHAIDTDLFDLSSFGACPICQQQVAELSSPDVPKFDYKAVTRLKVLGRKGSLSAQEKAFLRDLAENRAALLTDVKNRPEKVFGETIPFVYTLFGSDTDYMAKTISGCTDVLRIATFLSSPEGDLSLADNTKFRVSTKHRKRLLDILERTSNLAPDMMRHREKWLRLGEELHPGSAKNRARFPKTAEAFERLRNSEKQIPTFGRIVESAIRAQTVTPRKKRSKLGEALGARADKPEFSAQFLTTLASRPGDFMRRLDVIMRNNVGREAFEGALRVALPGVTTKMLFDVRKYLQHRVQGKNGQRVFFPKGSVSKVQVVEDARKPLDFHRATDAIGSINDELHKRLSKLAPMGRVAIDPALGKVVLPFNTRGDSETNVSVAKGSAYPAFSNVGGGPVIRLFVYWKKAADIDLSAQFLNEDFTYAGHVSYTNLSYGRNAGSVDVIHSGDIQNGAQGASEYIDFDPEVLYSKHHHRYLAVTVISYQGQPFDEYEELFAGFMERDAMKSGARYEPTSVALKLKITGKHKSHMPLVFDLKEKTVVFADLATGGGRYGRIEAGDKFQALARAAIELPLRKPTAYEVIAEHVEARGGTIVSAIEEPDRSFGLRSDLKEIVSEFIDAA